jgi:hypothetical protein
MKTSFPEILQTEKYVQHDLAADDALVYEARLLVDAELRRDTYFHRAVHRLVRIYHRKKLKLEVEIIHNRLSNDPANAAFRKAMMKLFNP